MDADESDDDEEDEMGGLSSVEILALENKNKFGYIDDSGNVSMNDWILFILFICNIYIT